MPIDPKVQQCIDACNRCIPAAHDCLANHVGEAEMKRCLQLCLDCTALCASCVPLLAHGSGYASRVCAICVDLCTECARECGKFDSKECQRCAQACLDCVDACRAMAA